MKKIKNKLTACLGCGRHPKQVSDKSIAYFCSHCVHENGNYNRYRNGQELIKPLKNIKENDILLGANGKPYLVIKFSNELEEDKFYLCQQFFGKEEYQFCGDYFFVKKLKIRESKKIRKMIEDNINTYYLTFNNEIKLSCLDCGNRKGNYCIKTGKNLIFCEANNCSFYY
ncbi:MAG: hypothetical protein NC222_06375 [Staphylococcus sp.]|nr:hypothetical protein [Staphylococcus sp.]